VGLRVRGCASLLPFGRPRLTTGAGVGGSSAFCEPISSPSVVAYAAVAISWAFKDSVSETGSIIEHVSYNKLKFLTTPEYIYAQRHGLIARGNEATEDVPQTTVKLRKRRWKANRIDVRVIFLEDHVP